MLQKPEPAQWSEAGPKAQETEQSTGLRRSQRLNNLVNTRSIRTFVHWHPAARYTDLFKYPPMLVSPSQLSILTKKEKRKYVSETAQRANSLPEKNVSFEETTVSTLTISSEEVQSTPTLID